MAVDAVIGGVQDAVLEPFDRDIARRVGGVLDLAEGLDPVDALGLLGPELVRVGDRGRVHLLVLGVVEEGALLPFRRDVVDFLGHPDPPTQPQIQFCFCRDYAMGARAATRLVLVPLSSRVTGSGSSAKRVAPSGVPGRSHAHGADDRAHHDQHREPMPGIDHRQRGLAAAEGVVDRHRGDHEAEPDERRRDQAVAQGERAARDARSVRPAPRPSAGWRGRRG